MTSARCIHGMDGRFCAVCNRTSKTSRGTAGAVTLDEILAFLNAAQERATYSAVGALLGIAPRAMAAQLGDHAPERSWVVSAGNGLPTDYSEADWHPALLQNPAVISSGIELALRLTAWKAKGEKP
jgi:hypothetical protein